MWSCNAHTLGMDYKLSFRKDKSNVHITAR